MARKFSHEQAALAALGPRLDRGNSALVMAHRSLTLTCKSLRME